MPSVHAPYHATSQSLWDRQRWVGQLTGGVVALSTIGGAVKQMAHWPTWVLLLLAPLVTAGATAVLPRASLRTVSVVGIVTAIISASGGGIYLVLLQSSDAAGQTSSSSTRPVQVTKKSVRHKTTKSVGYAIREMASDGKVFWAVAGNNTLLQFDATSLNQLGPAREIGTHIDHVALCGGHLLITYDAGMIAEVRRDNMLVRRRGRYGRPVAPVPETGAMTCGPHKVFVAMSLEARFVPVSLDYLRPAPPVKIGQRVAGLAASKGVVYAVDDVQNAVITARHGVPWRWIVTMPKPELIVPLTGGGTLLTHDESPCLGHAVEGQLHEQGLAWSAAGEVKAIAVGRRHGVLLDAAGWLYRFDATTGERDARRVRVKLATKIAAVTVTSTGQTIGSLPGRKQLVTIRPGAWRADKARPARANRCLN